MPESLPLSDPSFREEGAIRVREEREPGAILGAALALAKAEARPLFTAVFAIAGPMVLLAALARVIGGTVTGSVAGSVLDLAASLLSSAAVFGFVRAYAAGRPTEVGDVWDEARALVVPLLGYFAVVAVGAVLVMVPLVFVGTGVAALGVGVAAVGGVVLAAVVFVYLIPALSLGSVAVALDGMAVGAALRHVQALVRGRRARVVLTLLLMLAIAVFALVVLSAVGGSLVVAGLAPGDPTGGPATALTSAVLTLVMIPVGVVTSLVWVFLYGSLVDVTEGAALGSDLDRLAGADLLGVGRLPEAPRPDVARDAARRDEPRRDEASPEDFRPPAHPSDAHTGNASDGDAADLRSDGFRGGGFQSP